MHDRFFELPESAQRLLRAIEATLDEAGPLLADSGAPADVAFTLREMRSRYLPETIQAFLAIPSSQREVKDAAGTSPLDLMLGQLSILDRSTKRELESLAANKRSDLAANTRFLAERFDDRSTEISVPDDTPVRAASAPSLGQWLPADTASDAAQVVAVIAKRLQEHFPAMTQARYGGLFGTGRIESVSLTLPQGGGVAFRYALSAKDGVLEPLVTKLVHGTTIKTISCSANEWIESLYEDITAQAQHHAELRAPLTRLFSK